MRQQTKLFGSVGVKYIALMSLGIALNIVGGFIAVGFKLPIYIDSVGTILIACLLGPKYGVLTGVLGSVISGFTFDIYSLYFAPVQISTGYISGIMYQKGYLQGKKMLLGVLAFAVPTALMSAMIAAYVFGGVTSAGSSYIVQVLRAMGMPDVASVFVIQIMTEYADKYLATLLIASALKVIPKQFKASLRKTTEEVA